MAYLLIIDDDEDFASAAAKMLHDAGHEVAVELDTTSAVASMEKRRPDLVVLDVMFPEDASAGFQLARTMQHYNEDLKGIPVLMLTAVNSRFPLGFSSHDIDENWLPVAEFLEKPVDFDVLRNRVAELLEKAQSQTGNPSEET